MMRTIVTTALSFILLFAYVTLAAAGTDRPTPWSTPSSCQLLDPVDWNRLGGTGHDNSGNSSTGPTFPPVCWQTPAAYAIPSRRSFSSVRYCVVIGQRGPPSNDATIHLPNGPPKQVVIDVDTPQAVTTDLVSSSA